MKALAIALILSCAALALFADTRVDLNAVFGKDFIGKPSLDQAACALDAEDIFGGFGWEVVMNHIGLGGAYTVNFSQDASSAWWLAWEAQAIYASYHFFETKSFIDPFVDAGLGCAGQIFLGPSVEAGRGLALTIYPFVSGGAALNFQGFRVGAKLSYALSRRAVPVTTIPEFALGRFQAMAFVGVSLGDK